MLASLSPGRLLPKAITRRSFESNSPDGSLLCLLFFFLVWNLTRYDAKTSKKINVKSYLMCCGRRVRQQTTTYHLPPSPPLLAPTTRVVLWTSQIHSSSTQSKEMMQSMTIHSITTAIMKTAPILYVCTYYWIIELVFSYAIFCLADKFCYLSVWIDSVFLKFIPRPISVFESISSDIGQNFLKLFT